MAWVRLADDFYDHPKVLAAGPVAAYVWACGLAYANRYLTDGYLPKAAVRRLADVEDPYRVAARLVEVGLWVPAGDGYRLTRVSHEIGAIRRRPRVRAELRRAWEAIAHRVRPYILARDGRRCQLCGTTEGPMHVDHIRPLAWGGSNDPENLRCLCRPCNLKRGARWSG